VESEQAKSLRDGPVDRVYESIVSRVRELPNCPTFNTHDAWNGLSEMVGRLIDTVASIVRTFHSKWHWEATSQRPVAIPSPTGTRRLTASAGSLTAPAPVGTTP